MKIHNLLDDMAFVCECGSVKFNLLKSGNIECHECNNRYTRIYWREDMDDKKVIMFSEKEADTMAGYSEPIAKKGEQQFACIIRNSSGMDAGDIDFGARFIDNLSDQDQQDAVNAAYAVYEKWRSETGKKALRDN